MSIDSTELTFVRCPSCRSLVPAAQTRCRMCGATLDTSAKHDEEEQEAKKSGRVKQRTMSQPRNELSSAADQLRSDPEDAQADIAEPEEDVKDDVSTADPLGAYMEEVEEPIEVQEPQHVESKPAAAPITPKPVSTNGAERHESPAAPVQARPAEDSDAASRTPTSTEMPRPAQVRAESGKRPGQGGGLSFGRPREKGGDEERRGDNASRDSRDQNQKRPQDGASRSEWRSVGNELRGQPAPRHEDRTAQPAARQERSDSSASMQRPAHRAEASAARMENKNGRLFGWLVSYSTPDGASIELREGKFFISSSNLKGNDLVIEDPSIATPHALVSITAENGFRLQDLMSERGVFVRKREGDTYQRVEMTEVKHGDWVRFGDVEFVVALIAHVGTK